MKENKEIKEKIRTIDELGRIVIPIEIREECSISEKDKFKISVENAKIILEKI